MDKEIDHDAAVTCTSPERGPKVEAVNVPLTSFGGRLRIDAIINSEGKGEAFLGQIVTLCGWSRTVRQANHGELLFIALTDGSCVQNMQVVVEKAMTSFEQLSECGAGCSFRFVGEVVKSPAAGQAVELLLNDPEKHSVTIFGMADQRQYPLSKKKHGMEYLREIAHLRPRSFVIGAVTRVRSQMAMATHSFFHKMGFQYIHTPIITAADCEGAGEMFQVTTLLDADAHKIPTTTVKSKEEGAPSKRLVNYKKDFFGKPAYLTVSGQLALENFCCALCDVYTFGPTFRAENSHTSRHLAEFWMIEPEMAFADIHDNMRCAEAYLKYCVEWALTNCKSDIEWLDKNIESHLMERLQNIIEEPFARITYTEAITILEAAPEGFFSVKPYWGIDMASEHERYLTEKVYKKPVTVYNFPKDFKAFYMRQNEDGKTVAAMDVLLPKIGEVIGGSQREERLEKLDACIKEKGLEADGYWWYRDLRRYGTIPHSGFGLGFERLIMLITGIENIRDVIPFARYPGHAEF